ncbi:MAG TPA: D-alanyl-D-alanine carboxypeptidase family protein [Opitutaceae bacterium]
MNFRVLFAFLIASCLALAPLSAAKRKAAPAASGGGFKGAIVMDAETGKVLIDENADIVSPPASVTKLMTFLIVQDQIRAGKLTLQTPVTVDAADAKMGGTQVWLKEGETFPVEELLYALMIQSANDAATALAHAAAGSREAFVALMNARAKQLGMTNTTFRSPHGLPPSDRKLSDSDLTSPRDLAILSRELLRTTDILKYSSVRERPFRTNAIKPVIMRNHNHLLGKVAGVDGLKTGFTNSAEFCIAVTALRNGHRIIAVVMGSPDRLVRDLRAGELVERGFTALPADAPLFSAKAGAAAATAPAAAQAPAPAMASPISAAPSDAPASGSDAPTISYPGSKKK